MFRRCTYELLAGLSLEVLAKAILIERDPNLVDDQQLRRWPGSGHELLSLLTETGVDLAPDEVDVAERLGESVIWAGRYPIPTKAKFLLPRNSELEPIDEYPSRIRAIWNRLEDTLFEAWQQGRPDILTSWQMLQSGGWLSVAASSADAPAE